MSTFVPGHSSAAPASTYDPRRNELPGECRPTVVNQMQAEVSILHGVIDRLMDALCMDTEPSAPSVEVVSDTGLHRTNQSIIVAQRRLDRIIERLQQ